MAQRLRPWARVCLGCGARGWDLAKLADKSGVWYSCWLMMGEKMPEGKASMQDWRSRVGAEKAVGLGGRCAKVRAVAERMSPSPGRRKDALRVVTHCFAV